MNSNIFGQNLQHFNKTKKIKNLENLSTPSTWVWLGTNLITFGFKKKNSEKHLPTNHAKNLKRNSQTH
jgi:hypothetical protein